MYGFRKLYHAAQGAGLEVGRDQVGRLTAIVGSAAPGRRVRLTRLLAPPTLAGLRLVGAPERLPRRGRGRRADPSSAGSPFPRVVACAISGANSGLPPDASEIRVSSGRGKDQPSRLLTIW